MCHCTEYKLLLLHIKLSEENTLNAETQQFKTAKISVWALKQGSKTPTIASAQFTTKLQNETAL